MGQRSGVENDARRRRCLPLQEVDDGAFRVGLEADHLAAQLAGAAAQEGLDLVEGGGAVDVRLPRTQEVEVGPVDDQQALHLAGQGRRARTTLVTISAGTLIPSWALPISRGSTQRTLPPTLFLSRGTAARTASDVTGGSSPGRPNRSISAACLPTRAESHRPISRLIRAAVSIPRATALPCAAV